MAGWLRREWVGKGEWCNAFRGKSKQAAAQVPLPAEDQVLELVVLDVTGKGNYKTLVCEMAAPIA